MINKKGILIVDDSELDRSILADILQEKYKVFTAANGRDALAVLHENGDHIAVILLDLYMPVMNGYEATAAIRSLPGEQGKLPIVAMTANAFAEDVQLAKNTGMNGHIAKPLDMNKLNDVLESWL